MRNWLREAVFVSMGVWVGFGVGLRCACPDASAPGAVEAVHSPTSASTLATWMSEYPRPAVVSPGFRWDELESTDYRTYVANLLAVGCPARTIRDIIVADLHAAFEARCPILDRCDERGNRRQEERAALCELLGQGVAPCELCAAADVVEVLDKSPTDARPGIGNDDESDLGESRVEADDTIESGEAQEQAESESATDWAAIEETEGTTEEAGIGFRSGTAPSFMLGLPLEGCPVIDSEPSSDYEDALEEVVE